MTWDSRLDVVVTCDDCEQTTRVLGGSVQDVAEQLQGRGWTWTNVDGRDRCPHCSAQAGTS